VTIYVKFNRLVVARMHIVSSKILQHMMFIYNYGYCYSPILPSICGSVVVSHTLYYSYTYLLTVNN